MKQEFITFTHWTILLARLVLVVPMGAIILVTCLITGLKAISFFLRYGFEYKIYTEPNPRDKISDVYSFIEQKMKEDHGK